jgi:amino acid transporter
MDKQSIAKTPERKKIGLMSCIVVVIGACIGAGIFFKNGSILANTQHSLLLAILCWVVSGLGVLCMGLALTEIVSGCKKPSNLGIAYWIKTFNNRFLYKACKNFLVFIYTPIILIALSYYFMQALFSAINPLVN